MDTRIETFWRGIVEIIKTYDGIEYRSSGA